MTQTNPFWFLIALLFIACTNPEKEFEVVLANPTIKGFEEFAQNYQEHELASKAIFFRDSLVLINVLASNDIDSLSWFIREYPNSDFKESAKTEFTLFKNEIDFLSKKDSVSLDFDRIKLLTEYLSSFPNGRFLKSSRIERDSLKKQEENKIIETANRHGKIGLNSKNPSHAFNSFINAATQYIELAQLAEITGDDPKIFFEKAAYAYYKASKSKQADATKALASVFKNWINDSSVSLEELSKNTAKETSPHIERKNKYYLKSVEYYKKAGMNDHANWLLKEEKIKSFINEEIEKEWHLQ